MPRSAANADAARTTCSGARSRARKVLSPSSQPRPRRPPAERRHLFSGVVTATVVPPGTCRPPETQPPTTAPPRSRNPRRPKGTAREPPCPRSSAARPRSRRCVSRRDNHAQSARDTRIRPAAPPAGKLLLLSGPRRRKDSGVLFCGRCYNSDARCYRRFLRVGRAYENLKRGSAHSPGRVTSGVAVVTWRISWRQGSANVTARDMTKIFASGVRPAGSRWFWRSGPVAWPSGAARLARGTLGWCVGRPWANKLRLV